MTVEFRVLGTFEVLVDGRPIPGAAWRHRRAAEVVKVLALEHGHRLHREQIMDDLWPDLTSEAAAANLRKAIHYARSTLGFSDAISTRGEVVELGPPTGVSVDARVFASAARSALRSNDPIAARAAADLYTGELLPDDRYASWSIGARERLRALALQTLRLAARWDEVLDIDPADEEAHRGLMLQALKAGDRARAVRQFEMLRERLRIDLGMGPGPESVRLTNRRWQEEPKRQVPRAGCEFSWRGRSSN